MPFISMLPILQNNNNAILSDLKAMPLKDITSDGASSFTLGRMNYVRSYNSSQPNYIASNNVQKKWMHPPSQQDAELTALVMVH